MRESASLGLASGSDVRLVISVLGPFALQRHDGSSVRLPKKAQALVSFLAMNPGRSFPRDQLATLLWANSGTEQARQSLRQCLAALRNAMGPESIALLTTDTETVLLAKSEQVAVDAETFQAASESESLEQLKAAHALYRDEFLAGLHVPVEPFNRWVTIERQRLASMRLQLLQRLALAHVTVGEVDHAISAGRQLVALDPLREESHRLLMRLLAGAGDRSGALLQYEQCGQVLKEELGIDPDTDTRQLAEAVRSGSSAAFDVRATVVAPSVTEALEAEAPAVEHRGTGNSGPLTLPDKPSIVVLPFANLSGDPGRDYFVHGLVDDITVALGREKWLFVIASPSAFAVRDSAIDPRAIGGKLGVRYTLRGSVRIEAGQVLFVVQLHDTTRGEHIWSGRFQDEIDNVFAIQERLTTKVAATIAPALMSVEVERALHKPTENSTAFDLYLRALPRFRSSREDNREALRLLGKATELDPGYAAAYALAARCYQFQLMFGWASPGDPELKEGVRLAHLAIDKGKSDPEALWMAALALVHLAGEIDHCLDMLDRSLSLNPNSANAWIASCQMRSYVGDSNKAVDHFGRAQRLNPLDLSQHVHWNILAWAYLTSGRYVEAADAADRTLRVQPTYLPGLRLKVVTCGLLGRIEESHAYVQRLLAIQPNCSVSWMRAFLQVPLQRNTRTLERYLEGFRLAGMPEGQHSSV